jgi:hypothetical protein
MLTVVLLLLAPAAAALVLHLVVARVDQLGRRRRSWRCRVARLIHPAPFRARR